MIPPGRIVMWISIIFWTMGSFSVKVSASFALDRTAWGQHKWAIDISCRDCVRIFVWDRLQMSILLSWSLKETRGDQLLFLEGWVSVQGFHFIDIDSEFQFNVLEATFGHSIYNFAWRIIFCGNLHSSYWVPKLKILVKRLAMYWRLDFRC